MLLFIFRNKSENSGTATLAKNRLDNVLMNERGLQIGYLDNLKNDITNLMKQYAKTPHIAVNATANRDNTLDIKIFIGKIDD